MRKCYALSMVVFTMLFEMFHQLNKVFTIETPNISFGSGEFGYSVINVKWSVDINLDLLPLQDLYVRMVFPFSAPTPLQVSWTNLTSQCQKIRSLTTTTSTVLASDDPGAHFVRLQNAYFSGSNQYYMTIKFFDFPASGFYGLMHFSVVSRPDTLNFITYAYNGQFMNFYLYPAATNSLTVSTAPSSASIGYNIITKTFLGLVDITMTGAKLGSRLFFRLDTQTFRYDSAQTCEIIDVGTGYTYYLPGTYSCTFEDEINFKGLFLTLNSGTFPTGTKIRVQIKFTNPGVPSVCFLKVALMKSYEPQILEYVNVPAAFTSVAGSFRTGYPKLLLGPGLDTSASTYPGLPLMTSTTEANRIVFNSIRLDFIIDTDLPEPVNGYLVYVTINGNAKTSVPINYVYDNLPKTLVSTRKLYAVNAATKDITISNVGAMNSLTVYSVGFKLIIEGTESFNGGANPFLSVKIVDQVTNTVVFIGQSAPVGANAAALTVVNQASATANTPTLPTIIHTVPAIASGASAAAFGTISLTNYGVTKGNGYTMFIRGNLGSGLTPTASASYIEIITNSQIQPTTSTSWSDTNAPINCIVTTSAYVDQSTNIKNCFYQIMNKGVANQEYATMRIGCGATTANFWWSAGSDRYFGWRTVNIPVSNSMFINDIDSAILDAYINLYQNDPITDISTSFGTPTKRLLDNIHVVNYAALTNAKVEHVNYFRHSTDTFDDNVGTSFLRVSGILNNVNTFKAQKLLLFYTELDPQYLDSDKYEIGCATSDVTPVRCYYKGGLLNGNRACGAGTCTDMIFRETIEIHFTTSAIAVSNAQNFQILIPVKLKTTASPANIPVAIGVCSVHSGGYSTFNQLIEYVNNQVIAMPSSYPIGAWTSKKSAVAQVNLASVLRPGIFQIETGINGVIGRSFSSNLNIDCPAANSPCNLASASEWYSMTMCGDWNFMDNPDFNVNNPDETFDVPDIYHVCIKNLRYLNSVTGNLKYCLWCPFFSATNVDTDQSRSFVGMKLPDYYSNKWPPGTYSMFSGRSGVRGLENYVDFTDQSYTSFTFNRLTGVTAKPLVWYKNYQSMKLSLYLTTNSPLYVGGTIQFVANTILPLSFAYSGTNPYCSINVTNQIIPCTSQKTTCSGATCILISITAGVPSGNLIIDLLGVNIDPVIASSTATYYIVTTTPQGTTSAYYVDKSDQEAISVTFQDYPTGTINTPSITNVMNEQSDQRAISTLNITVALSNDKLLYRNDLLRLQFDATPPIASYDATQKPFSCYVVNNQGQIMTAFRECYAKTPTSVNAGLMLTTTLDSVSSMFTIVLENFDYVNGIPTYGAYVATYSAAATTVDSQTMAMTPFTALSTPTALNAFSVVKQNNFVGGRPDIVFTFKTQTATVSYASKIKVQLHKDYDGSMIDNVHNCELTDPSGTKSFIFCVVEVNRQLEITGFATTIAAMSTFSVTVSGIFQPKITSPSEFFYAQLFDANGVLQESQVVSLVGPNALSTLGTSLKLLSIFDLSFSSTFIRSTNNLVFSFTSQNSIAPNSLLYVYLDYFSYEYFILPTTNIDCSLETTAGVKVQSGTCTRVGKRILIKNGGTIAANTVMKIKINNLVTVNYDTCKMSQISMMIVQGTTLTDYAPPENVNVQPISADLDPTLTYLNFEGMSGLSFINIKRGIYNRLNIVRMDGKRFNDQLQYTLSNTFNGMFDVINPSDIEKVDSYFGQKSMPILLGSSKTSILTIFLISVNKAELFKVGRFAPLPFLIIKTTTDKVRFPVPTALKVYRGYESLAMMLNLVELPQADLVVSVSTITYDSGSLLMLKSSSTLTMSKSALVSEIVVKYNKPVTSDPASITTSLLRLSPPADSPYLTTDVQLQVVDLVVDTSTKFGVIITDTTPYGCIANIPVHMPLTVYYYIVPQYLYVELSADYIDNQLKVGNTTDGYIVFGKMNVESSLTGYDLCQNRLLANTSYILRMYYKTFTVQNLNSNAASSSGNTTNTTTGGFEPLKRPDFGVGSVSKSTIVPRYDQGMNWTIFTTEANQAQYGYLDINFLSVPSVQNKMDLCCYFGQALSYPLENVWTNDSYRCPSKTLSTNITYFSGLGYKAARRLEESASLHGRVLVNVTGNPPANTSNVVRLYLMPNARASQDQGAWATLTSLVFASTFLTNLQSQYPSIPKITSMSPLLSVDQIPARIDNFAKFTVLDDGKSGYLTGIKPKNSGTVWSIILLKNVSIDTAISYQHIKLGLNPLNLTAAPIAVSKKYYSSVSEDYNLTLTSMTLDQTYTLYYFATSIDPNLLPSFTPIYKYDFIIRSRTFTDSWTGLAGWNRTVTICVLMTLLITVFDF